ncbi:MAG: hypothetical protein JJ863_21540 [Deltaproteobacteria bacterium]|nr:hypothetical protein [Deltaproteobacteria bacterium]
MSEGTKSKKEKSSSEPRGVADRIADRTAEALAEACADELGGGPVPVTENERKHLEKAVALHMQAQLRGWRDTSS